MDGIRRASLSCTAFLCCVVFLCIAYFSGVRVNLSGSLPHRLYRIAVLPEGKALSRGELVMPDYRKIDNPAFTILCSGRDNAATFHRNAFAPNRGKMRCPPARCFFNIDALSRTCRPAHDAGGLRIRTPQNAGPGWIFQYNHKLNFTIDIFYKPCYSLLQLSATQRWLGKHWGCRLRKDDK